MRVARAIAAARPIVKGSLVLVRGGRCRGLVFRVVRVDGDKVYRAPEADGMPQIFAASELIAAYTDQPTFRAFDTGYSEVRGKVMRVHVCEELIAGRWEGFVSIDPVQLGAGGKVN